MTLNSQGALVTKVQPPFRLPSYNVSASAESSSFASSIQRLDSNKMFQRDSELILWKRRTWFGCSYSCPHAPRTTLALDQVRRGGDAAVAKLRLGNYKRDC
jgi:hypothetical protein